MADDEDDEEEEKSFTGAMKVEIGDFVVLKEVEGSSGYILMRGKKAGKKDVTEERSSSL